MFRSEVNTLIAGAIEFCASLQFKLPPFAFWTPDEWRENYGAAREIVDNQMGWDITDFGGGDFASVGLLIFVLRNGNANDARYAKPYCEKILIQDERQILPMHFHWRKMEDIIVRGGGNLMVELHNAVSDAEPDLESPVKVTIDGRAREVVPGEPIRLTPGESITLLPRQFHKFWAEPGSGRVLLGEVSTTSDEEHDNNFPQYSGRLPEIEEDEGARHLLFRDYPQLDRGPSA